MQKHVKNYLEQTGYSGVEFIPCEVCKGKAVDIHHIKQRSKFGSKMKDEQDNPKNLIALCRLHHDKAHADKEFNNSLFEIADSREV
jgi:hypothetical protein